MNDPYRDSAEYLDIMSRDAWRTLGPALAGALARVDPAAGPAIDLGAGTGLGTLTIAEALPRADIIAVEPSAGLRAVLLSRLVTDPGLTSRVTVLGTDLQHATLPEHFGAVTAINMIGHLGPQDRAALWALLAERLAPGAPAVLNLQPPGGEAVVPDTRFCAIPIGRHTYEGWGRAEPGEPDSVTWHMRYRVLDGETLISERTVDYQWWILTENQLHTELTGHNLTAHPTGPPEAGLYTITHATDR